MKDAKTTDWERLQSVIEKSGMSINMFAQHVGLAAAEELYLIKRGEEKISPALAECVVASFPEVDADWLMHGEQASSH